MRKLFLSVALSSLVLALGACASGGTEKQAGGSDGVTGATIKRAAVSGGFVDFGGDANSVENDDLQTQSVGLDNPVSSDERRDQEIDEIVNKISNDKGQPAEHATPPSSEHRKPAVMHSASIAANSAAADLAENGRSNKASSSSTASGSGSASGEDATLAAERERLFPKPRWRRETESKSQPASSDSATGGN